MSGGEWKAVWDSIPSLFKVLGGLATGFISATVAIGAALDIPDRVGASERAITEHAVEIGALRSADREFERRLDRSDLRFDYAICLLEALSGEGRRTSGQCAADFARGNP